MATIDEIKAWLDEWSGVYPDAEKRMRDLIRMVEELEKRNVVTPEYLDSWIGRANDAEARVAKLQAQVELVKALPKHEVTKDVFSHEYVIVSCGVRNGVVVYFDDIAAALNGDQ